MGEKKLCYGCMMQTEYRGDICQRCGYNASIPVNETFLQPGTELNDRYIIGTPISMNGEGITYIALDRSVGCRVLVREYMPLNFSARAVNSPVVSVNSSKMPQYKVLLEEFIGLNKSLAQIREQVQVNRVTDLFTSNNTAYVVYEYVDGMRFVDFLKENAGELSWGQLSGMLPPFLTSLSILHNSGVLHRAISPETIYVTKKCELKLTDFSISAVRTADTELDCEIFSGYAAPEQYSASNRQGTWTDVYAVCAVIYRVLTGSMPTSAISRMENDNLIAPCLLNPNISRHVSDVIMKGLNLVSTDRIQTVTELVTQLFSEKKSFGAPVGGRPAANDPFQQTRSFNRNDYQKQPEPQYDDYSHQGYSDDYSYEDYGNDGYQRNTYTEAQPSAIDRVKVPLIIGMLLLVILLIALYFMFSKGGSGDINIPEAATTTVTTTVQEEQSATENTTPDGDGIMPNLIGKSYEVQYERYSSWMKFKVEEVFNDEYEEGTIVGQEIEEGEYFDTSVPVIIQVSKGPVNILLPAYSNVNISDYTKALDELGVKYKIEPDVTAAFAANTVSKLSFDISMEYNRKSAQEIVVYYAVAPSTTPTTTTTTVTTTTVMTTQAATTPPVVETTTMAPVVTDPPVVDPAVPVV